MNNLSPDKIKILVVPLDWGLGHTTRCIPVIYELLQQGVAVILAGNSIQKLLLQKECPQCAFIDIQGYNVRYSHKNNQALKMLWQMPRLLKTIYRENKWLKKVIKEYKIDGIISDNRFGLYNHTIPCVFITHQLRIKIPQSKWMERLVQYINYTKINQFRSCWIPDFEGVENLSGELSHAAKKPYIPCEYIGPLSRMKALPVAKQPNHLLILLSGPEPQRSIFEEIILSQIGSYKGTITIVRGLPASNELLPEIDNVTIYNHLDKEQLNEEMCKAGLIICRSGYSSIMDIASTGSKAILVPTPGQTEQEYLATYLMERKFAISCPQQHCMMKEMLQKAKVFTFNSFNPLQKDLLTNAVKKFITDCKNRSAK